MTPLETLIARVIHDEGGVADVGDGKGMTRFGQTPDWLARFQLLAPRTSKEATANYLQWIDLIGFHPLVDAGDNLAWILLDIAVMSDHPKAVKALQAAVGIHVDGAIGPETQMALTMAASREILAHLVVAWDMEYQGSIITMNPQRAQYAKNWARRMARHVRDFI